MLVKTNVDYTTLPAALLPAFKEHLRVLGTQEDENTERYLAGAIDAISTYGDVDIFETEYEYIYVDAETDKPSGDTWYTGKSRISNVILTDSEDNDLLVAVNEAQGYIYPAPLEGNICTFSSGYADETLIPPNVLSIIFRYGSHLNENREAIQIGEPKYLPDWVFYAMASIWKPRL